MDMTSSQDKAVKLVNGNLQLIACAGSGKTEVVARRIANLLAPTLDDGGGLSPRNIVAFTFTEKAAAELKERVTRRSLERVPNLVGLADMYIGTVHGFCLDLLKTEVPEFLKYEILNDVQQTLFISRNSRRCGLSGAQTLAGAALHRYKDAQVYTSALTVLRESQLDHKKLAGNTVFDGLSLYRDLLSEKRYLDYSAILEEAVQALRSDESLRQRLASRYKIVVVDEYQDLNPIQESLVLELHKLGATLTVVGDDDQTLYQWRGSDLNNILTFSERYPAVKRITLEDNFRSSEGIIDVARLAIEDNQERLPKQMRAADAQFYQEGDIVALRFDTPEKEAEYIAATCQSLLGTFVRDDTGRRAISWSDMAVLVRVGKCGEIIREALLQASIPVVSVGMSSLFEAKEAEAARQLFYLLAGVQDVTAGTVMQAWVDADLGLDRRTLKKAIKEADTTREKMRQENDEVRFSVYNLQRQFVSFMETLRLQEDGIPNTRGETVFYNLGKFSQAISDFESIHFHSRPVEKYRSFADFLRYQAEVAYSEIESGDDSVLAMPDAVQILTIHRAKGLQWPVVFVPQLVKNRFPISGRGGRSVWHLIPAEGIKNQARYCNSFEDERRLFYVAVTRSQKHLHLTWAPTNQLYKHPSIFFEKVMESKFVKRRRIDLSKRKSGMPQALSSVSNMTLSFSDVKYFIDCPYQFKLRILYGFNAPLDEALGWGKSLHDALAELHARAIRGESVTEQLSRILIERHMHVPYAYPSLRDTMTKAAERTLTEYIRTRKADLQNLEMSERAIEVRMEKGVTLRGRIDLVRRRDTGETSIVDFKSSEHAQELQQTEAQLHMYALGYRELTGRDANLVEIYNLDEQKRVVRSVDDTFIADVKSNVLATAQAMRDNTFAPKPGEVVC